MINKIKHKLKGYYYKSVAEVIDNMFQINVKKVLIFNLMTPLLISIYITTFSPHLTGTENIAWYKIVMNLYVFATIPVLLVTLIGMLFPLLIFLITLGIQHIILKRDEFTMGKPLALFLDSSFWLLHIIHIIAILYTRRIVFILTVV